MKRSKQHSTDKTSRPWWRQLTRGSIKDEEHLLFSAFIISLLTIIVINTLYIINKQSIAANNTERVTNVVSRPQKVFTSQQTATSPVYSISLSHVTEKDTFDPAFTIASNETMLILTLSITNTSNGAQSLVPSQQLYVRSNDGDYAQLHASMFATNPITATNLKPGQTVTGDVSFNVPKTQARPLLYIDLGWNNYGPVVFDVLH